MGGDGDGDGDEAGVRPAADNAVVPAPECKLLEDIDSTLGEEAERRAAGLQRRLADDRLLAVLAADKFTGPRYRRFEDELIAYAISVLRGWLHSGYIFKLAAARHLNVAPTGDELEELCHDTDARDELAHMTVALALPKFRERALLGGGWRVDGGASLTTYFMGACLYEFPNEFRGRRAYQRNYSRAVRAEAAVFDPTADDRVANAATLALGDLRVIDDLKDLDSLTAEVVTATMAGYLQQEIAEMFGLPSARAVEGILYRWRLKAKPDAHRGGDLG